MKTRILFLIGFAMVFSGAGSLRAVEPAPAPAADMKAKYNEARKKALADPAVKPAYEASKAARQAFEAKIQAKMKETDPSTAPLFEKLGKREKLAPEETVKFKEARAKAAADPSVKADAELAKKAEADLNQALWPKMKALDPSVAPMVDEMQKKAAAGAAPKPAK